MNIKTKLMNKENFTYKFSDRPLADNGRLSDGIAEPTFDEFLTRMVNEPVFLNQSTVVPMTSVQHDLDMFGREYDFESQRFLTSTPNIPGQSKTYDDLTDVGPERSRKQLLAHPLALKSVITQNFIDENIEKEGFLDTWTSYLAAQAGPAMERYGIFAELGSSERGHASGFHVTTGILPQLLDGNGGTQSNKLGIGNLVYSNEVLSGVFRNINRYVDNDGELSNATLVLPPQIYSRFMAEVGSERTTDLGDVVWDSGKYPRIMGIEIKNDHVLRNSPNGFASLRFKGGEYTSSGGDVVTNMLYGFLSKPTNNVFGIMRDTEVKQEYSIDVLGYKTALLAKADAKVLFLEDTLAIPFTLETKS